MGTSLASPRNGWRRWLDPLDTGIVAVVLASGLLGPYPLHAFYSSVLVAFCMIVGPLLAAAWVVHRGVRGSDGRLQGPRRTPPRLRQEIGETVRAMFVVACMAAWPLTQYRLGEPTGMVWELDAAGGFWTVLGLNLVVGILAIDAWTYLKHRLLHTRLLFRFHKHHHAFRDPSPFAGFAISPLEAVWTFWPLLLICIPAATHWAPLYFALVVGFVLLNLYLHSGVSIGWIERFLPYVLLNTSAFHNLHHSRVDTNYGEVLFLWDLILGTADARNPHHVPSSWRLFGRSVRAAERR